MRSSYRGGEWVWPSSGPQLVRWGSIFAGTVISLGLFILLSALWLALSFANHDPVVYNNVSWWFGGTAIFCMFLSGLIAGLTSGVRGAGAGAMNALTTWALVSIVAALVAVPTFSIGHIPSHVTVSGHVYRINYVTYWTAFWSVLSGLVASLFGGLMGGIVPRRAEGPYLDLSRTMTREVPTVDRRLGEQPVRIAAEPAVTAAQTAANVYVPATAGTPATATRPGNAGIPGNASFPRNSGESTETTQQMGPGTL